MNLIIILLLSLIFNFYSNDRPIITKEGNVTTTIIGDKIYKSAESEIGEAWYDEKKK